MLHFDEDLMVKIENEIANKKNKYDRKYQNYARMNQEIAVL